jgi:AcrR family transcriptional regulator
VDIIDYPELPQKERILKIAAQLFAKRGFHAVGMSDLQDAVKLGRGALYHHIRSKEDLLYEISREYIHDLAQSATQLLATVNDPAERVCRLGAHLVRKIASHQAELTVCFREFQSLTEPRHGEVLEYHSKYERAWRDTMVDGADSGQFRAYDQVTLKAVLGMYFYGYLWMTPGRAPGAEVIADRLNDLTLRMLKA